MQTCGGSKALFNIFSFMPICLLMPQQHGIEDNWNEITCCAAGELPLPIDREKLWSEKRNRIAQKCFFTKQSADDDQKIERNSKFLVFFRFFWGHNY